MKDKISTIEQIAISLWIIAQSVLIILTDINVLTLNSTIIFIPSYLLILVFTITTIISIATMQE